MKADARWQPWLFATHSWLGAGAAACLFVLCFSGSWAVLGPEWQRWENPPAPGSAQAAFASADLSQLPWERIVARAVEPGSPHLRLQLPRDGQPWLLAQSGARGPLQVLDLASGESLPPLQAPVSQVVTQLHKNLHAGLPGRVLVSLFGMVLLLLWAGGMAMVWPRWRKVLQLPGGKSMRATVADAHRLVGWWLSPLVVLLAVTGLFSGLGAWGTLGLAPLIWPQQQMAGAMAELMPRTPQAGAAVLSQPQPQPQPQPQQAGPAGQLLAPAPTAGLQQLLAQPAVQQAVLAMQRVESIELQAWGTPQAVLSLAGTRTGQLSSALFERWHFRAADAVLLRQDSAEQQGMATRIFIAMQPLHFARYGGAAVRAMHASAGMALALMCATGLFLWQSRRAMRGAQGWGERLWLVLGSGSCVGLLVAASAMVLAYAMAPAALAPSQLFWPLWPLVALSCALGSLGRRLQQLLGLSAAMLLLAIAIRTGAGAQPWLPLDGALLAWALLQLVLVRVLQRQASASVDPQHRRMSPRACATAKETHENNPL